MKNIVIFSGAGLSSDSGIPTFRDSGSGLWYNHKVEDVATASGWRRNKELVVNFYRERWDNIKAASPNAAHLAIAKLAETHRVHNITQNIDDLLERAGCKNVWHLHGSIDCRKCENHKSVGGACDYAATHTEPVRMGDRCPTCNAQLRPDVTWFEESVDMREQILETIVKQTDIFIGVGSSLQVWPASDIVFQFRNVPKKYFVDKNPSSRLHSFEKFTGKACDKIPIVIESILAE